jgi:hypothetical protein
MGTSGHRAPQIPANRNPITAGQHHIKDDEVINAVSRQILAFNPVMRLVDDVALLFQHPSQCPRQALIVLDNQDPHLYRCSLATV